MPHVVSLLKEKLFERIRDIHDNQEKAFFSTGYCTSSLGTANPKNLFRKENIRCLQWPAQRPDLNIIENV